MTQRLARGIFRRRFSTDETGAVTVDWVVLSAAVVYMGVYSIGTVQSATNALAQNLSGNISQPSSAPAP